MMPFFLINRIKWTIFAVNIYSLLIMVRIVSLLLLLFLLPVDGAFAQKGKQFTVVLDPGHGGHDPGAVNGKVLEKDLNLSVSKKLAKKIEEKYPEVKVILTRSTDVFIELHDRSSIAHKANADLFISIHANAVKDRTATGVEVVMWGVPSTEDEKRIAMYENQVVKLEKDKGAKYKKYDKESDEDYILKQLMFDEDLSLSADLAEMIQTALVKRTRLADRGVKSSTVYVLRQTAMPRVLVEMGFVSNAGDRDFITSDAGQKKIVDGVFDGFSEYYELYGKVRESVSDEADSSVAKADEGKVEAMSGVPVFKVQLFAADTKLESNDKRFKGLKTSSFKEGKWYKYTYGETEDYNKAVKMKKDIADKFKDAFVIAFIDGKRVDMSKALEIFRKNQQKKK